MYDPDNQFEPGTAEHFTKTMANQASARAAAQFKSSGPMTFGRSLGPAVFWCGLFVVGVFASTGAFKTAGRFAVIGGVALLAVAILWAAYTFLLRPTFKLTSLGWKSNVLTRSVIVGATFGVGFGAWLGYSEREILRGILRLGVMGTVLGVAVGVVLLLLTRASKRMTS